MDEKLKSKLERYLKNASRFLWGLSRGNQKITYPWLLNRGKKLWGAQFEFKYGPYADVISQLLINPGIEKLLKDLVTQTITKELFAEKALDFLRDRWKNGILPSMSDLKGYNIHDPYPFCEINTQFNYVERWGDFAGVWFEEIEPWLKEEEENNEK
jgi:hypothetical protein